ncbi:MAG: hypothetical protein HFJ84_00355 [Clostridiales bacterium]|jgi:hypothetical protein|nr:hypothetical protein [Clostridiales bacterium]
MSNDKVIDELLARIQALEEKVDALSKQTLGEDAKDTSEGQEKRCLPGYNSCVIK